MTRLSRERRQVSRCRHGTKGVLVRKSFILAAPSVAAARSNSKRSMVRAESTFQRGKKGRRPEVGKSTGESRVRDTSLSAANAFRETQVGASVPCMGRLTPANQSIILSTGRETRPYDPNCHPLRPASLGARPVRTVPRLPLDADVRKSPCARGRLGA